METNSFLQSLSNVFVSTFNELWVQFVEFLPSFIGAIIVFIIGWIIAVALGNLVARVVSVIKINEAVEKLGVTKGLERAGIVVRVDQLLGWIVKWFLIIVFLIMSADILQWTEISRFLNLVVNYLPNVFIAVVILIIGIVVADFIRDVIETALRAGKFQSSAIVAGIAKWAVLIFTFMAVLVELSIAQDLIQTLFIGFVAMLSLAGGLAFGLGGRDKAQDVIKTLSKDLTKKE